MLFPYFYIIDNSKPWTVENCLVEFKDKKATLNNPTSLDDALDDWEVTS